MRDKMKKTLGILLATLTIGAAFVGCGDGSLKYDGDKLDGYQSEASVTSNGGFAVQKGDYVYFINGRETEDAANEYGDVVKGALMRISKTDLDNGNYENVKTVVPSVLAAKDYNAGIFIYGDYVYYATPTTDKTDKGEAANSYIDLKRAKIDGTEGPMKDYFVRLSDNASEYRFVQEGKTVYCLYEEGGALKSVNTDTKEVSTLVEGATSEFFYDALDKENPYVYYTMGVTPDGESTQEYNQVYRVNAGATAKVTDEKNAKYTVYDADGNKVKEYAFDKDEMQEENDKAKEENKKAELPYDFEDYTTYSYVNLGELVFDGIGSADYLTHTQYNAEKVSVPEKLAGYKYTLSTDCYQNGTLYLTRSSLDASTESAETTVAQLLYVTDADVDKADWNAISGNATLTANVAGVGANAKTGSALFYVDETTNEHSYIYVANNHLYRATYKGNTTEEVKLVDGIGTPTLWKLDTEKHYVYFYSDSGNGAALSRLQYNGEAEDYNHLAEKKEYSVVSLDYLVFNTDWYMPEIFGDTVMYSNAETFGSETFDYVYATKMGSVAEIETANEKYQEVQDEINKYATYTNLLAAMKCYYRTGERVIFDEFASEFKGNKSTKFEEFIALFAEGGKFEGMMESDFTAQVGAISEEDKIAMREGWRSSVRVETPAYDKEPVEETETTEEEQQGLPAWAIVIIVVAALTIVILAIVFIVRAVREKKRKALEESATVNAYKRKKIDTTDDKSIDVYATDEEMAEETAEEPPVQEESADAPVEENTENNE